MIKKNEVKHVNENKPEISNDSQISIKNIVSHIVPLETNKSEKVSLEYKDILLIDSDEELNKGMAQNFNARFESANLQVKSVNKNKYDMVIVNVPQSYENNAQTDMTYFENLFSVFQNIELDVDTRIVAIAHEENFGQSSAANPLSGGVSGFIKTLSKEYGLKAKQIYSNNLNFIYHEIENWDNLTEVAELNSKRVTLVKKEHQPGNIEKIGINSDDLMLVTGGARGICFECIKELCKEKKPGIALLGRTSIPDNIGDYLSLSQSELKSKRDDIKNILKAEGKKATPVNVEKRWKSFLNCIQIAQNINFLKGQGINVSYYSVDISSQQDVVQVINRIEKDFNIPVSIIIHAAGIEESKKFANKNLETAKKIVSVKLDGIWNILNSINQNNLKRIICFSSIAGRFGNIGQIDYAFANGYLSKLCWNFISKRIFSLGN